MAKAKKSFHLRKLYPIGAGLIGSGLLALFYFGIVSWAESPAHAWELFKQDLWIVIPILLGFGVQAALYTILKLRLYFPEQHAPGASLGAGGVTSTLTMAACCAHHVADVFPVLGLTAAATFLARYRLTFMGVGLGTNLLGIGYLLFILTRERRRAIQPNPITLPIQENS